MAALSDAGLNVIVDSVITDPPGLETIVSIFHEYPAYFVCIDLSIAAAEDANGRAGIAGRAMCAISMTRFMT